MIKIQGIEKSFGQLQVLKGIDLEIGKGEVVSIVGPSGAGKTTLLQIIGTLDRADCGTVTIDGVDTSCMSTNKLAEFRNRHIGFVFQFHQLLPEFTAIENAAMPAHSRDCEKASHGEGRGTARTSRAWRPTAPQAVGDVGR